MEDVAKYIIYGSVVISALILGRWYAKERDIIMSRGEPWIKSFVTIPGVLILLIIGGLIVLKLVKG